MRRAFIIPGFIAVLIIGFAALLWQDSARVAAAPSLLGQRAPVVHPLVGAGEPVLINFWFSTCGPCVAEHPRLLELAENLTILGINRDVSEADAAAFLTDLGNPFAANIYDPRDDLAKAFSVTSWPTSFLVAGNGLIQGIYGPFLGLGAADEVRMMSAPEVYFEDPSLEDRAQAFFAYVACLDCAASSIQESGGNFAVQLRKQIRLNMSAGLSDADIQAGLIARYGPTIWLRPPLNTQTIALYALPFFGLGLGLFFLVRRGRA